MTQEAKASHEREQGSSPYYLLGRGCPADQPQSCRAMTMIRVLIADDHQLIQEGVDALLAGTPGLTLIGQATSAAEAVRLYEALQPDVMLMDLRLGEESGMDAAAAILQGDPNARIVAFSAHGGKRLTQASLEVGMVGYVMKDAPPEQIIAAITTATQALDTPAPNQPEIDLREASTLSLTKRETEMVHLVSLGWSNRQLANELDIALKTVESHLSATYAKIGVTNRSQAALWAQKHLELKLPDDGLPRESAGT